MSTGTVVAVKVGVAVALVAVAFYLVHHFTRDRARLLKLIELTSRVVMATTTPEAKATS